MHFFSSATVLFLPAAAVSLTIPRGAAPPTAKCTATNHANTNALVLTSYVVEIEIPFNNGSGCDAVQGTIHDAVGADLQGWDCEGDDDGNTVLVFGVSPVGKDDDVNRGLGEAYPAVIAGFDCAAS